MKKLIIATSLVTALTSFARAADFGFISKDGMTGFEVKASFIKAHAMTNFGDGYTVNGVFTDKSISELGLALEPSIDLDKDRTFQLLPFAGIISSMSESHSSILDETKCRVAITNSTEFDTSKCHSGLSASNTLFSNGILIKANMKITNEVNAYFKFGAVSDGNYRDFKYEPQASVGLSIEF